MEPQHCSREKEKEEEKEKIQKEEKNPDQSSDYLFPIFDIPQYYCDTDSYIFVTMSLEYHMAHSFTAQ